MKSVLTTLAFVCLATTAHGQTLTQADAEARAQTKQISAVRVIMVGDSTTAVQSGWGGAFCADHLTSFAACINLARGGRSSFSYRAEGSWNIALAEMKSGGYAKTWVLIQFGHNDQPGKPGRSTDLKTEFPAFIRQYVSEARAAGAIPVLVTPLTRRSFKDGQLDDDLASWAAATRQVAADMNVPLVDLHARSRAVVQALGPLQAMSLAQVPPPPDVVAAAGTGTTISAAKAPASPPAPAFDQMAFAKQAFDYTHLGKTGADMISGLVSEELSKNVPDLRPYIIP
ncbi:rhamnogalacturonan acetylesterase [Asticcacaulis sp.]|uniref:rhamnogalacturonan acetylesterase n=1 Tax=Asticcacaulis sp. TaxID=1872648 RepID=UPI003F7BD87D